MSDRPKPRLADTIRAMTDAMQRTTDALRTWKPAQLDRLAPYRAWFEASGVEVDDATLTRFADTAARLDRVYTNRAARRRKRAWLIACLDIFAGHERPAEAVTRAVAFKAPTVADALRAPPALDRLRAAAADWRAVVDAGNTGAGNDKWTSALALLKSVQLIAGQRNAIRDWTAIAEKG